MIRFNNDYNHGALDSILSALTAANAALFNGEWKKGHRYTYNLQLDKNDITLKNVEIKAWTEKDGSSQNVPPVIE